jgi:aminopeptidase C
MQIPPPRKNPYDGKKRTILFLGSIAAPRMITIMNTLAARLNEARIHVVGLNKVHWYGTGEGGDIHPSIVQHG